MQGCGKLFPKKLFSESEVQPEMFLTTVLLCWTLLIALDNLSQPEYLT